MEKRKDTRRALVFRMSDKEWEMFDKCVEEFGSKKTEFLKLLIKTKYEKMFPYYTRSLRVIPSKEQDTPLTLEQKCEMIGGKIVKDNTGNKICKIQLYKNAFSEGFNEVPLQHDLLDQEIKAKKNRE